MIYFVYIHVFTYEFCLKIQSDELVMNIIIKQLFYDNL